MADSITLQQIRKEYSNGGETIVAADDISVEIPSGEFVTIVGPSGCGKTTVLRTIAGLQEPTSGKIYFGDEEVTAKPPQERNISMVFQNIALYPHMSVRENIGYSLKVNGVDKTSRDEKIEEAASILQITEQLDKMPSELSGGQQQRVALGAAFVKEPEIILFDEPMSDLDAKLKADLRVEIQRLHKQLDATMVYVTHDQTEAMTMSDRVITMKKGRIEQFDPPKKLFDRPRTRHVADFIGTPSMNFLEYTVQEQKDSYCLDGYGHRIPIPKHIADQHVRKDLEIGVRPQYLSLREGDYQLPVTVDVVEPLGTESVIHARTGEGTSVDIVSSYADGLESGETITVGFDDDVIILFDERGQTILFGEDLEDDPSIESESQTLQSGGNS